MHYLSLKQRQMNYISKNWTIKLMLLLCTQLSCATDIYKWTDAQGQLHYSNIKHADATKLTLRQDYSFYTIKKVYDGDTVLLSDGRKIRLLGINTPEIEHFDKVGQAGGEAARQWLKQQLLNTRVRLEFDQQKHDKYQRYLAHLFTKQGEHINLQLVRRGYASINIYPPNLIYVTKLLKAEQAAEAERLGIWSYPEYTPKQGDEINKRNKQGWQRIVGRVLRIKRTAKNTYLKLGDNFYVRIKKAHLQYFNTLDLLKGKKIEVRGWVWRYKNGYSMSVRHPAAIKIVN